MNETTIKITKQNGHATTITTTVCEDGKPLYTHYATADRTAGWDTVEYLVARELGDVTKHLTNKPV